MKSGNFSKIPLTTSLMIFVALFSMTIIMVIIPAAKCRAQAEATKATVLWMKPPPVQKPPPEAPKPKPELTYRGSLLTGYESLKNTAGDEHTNIHSKSLINLSGTTMQGGAIAGNLQWDRRYLTTGDINAIVGFLELRQPDYELAIRHNFSDSGNIVNRINTLTRTKNTEINLKSLYYKNLPISLRYLRTENATGQAGYYSQSTQTSQFNLMATKNTTRAQTNIIANLMETSTPTQGYKTKAKTITLNSNIKLNPRSQLQLNFQPTQTQTSRGTLAPQVKSTNINSSAKLTVQLTEKLRFKTNFSLFQNKYTSGTHEVKQNVFDQEYILGYQLLPFVELESGYDISHTGGANTSTKMITRLAYSAPSAPGRRVEVFRFGRTSLDFQLIKVEDDTRKLLSRNYQLGLNSSLQLAKDMQLTSRFTNRSQRMLSALSGLYTTVDNKNRNFNFTHRLSPTYYYDLQYNRMATQSLVSPTSDTTNYTARANFELKLKEQKLPISLMQIATNSKYSTCKADTKETALSIQLPNRASAKNKQLIKYTFSFGKSDTTGVAGAGSRDISKHIINISLKGSSKPLSLDATLGLIHTTKRMVQANVAFIYPFSEATTATLNFIRNDENATIQNYRYSTRNLLFEITRNF